MALSAAADGSAPKLQRTVHAVELPSLGATLSSSRAFPSSATEPSTSSSSPSPAVVVVNFSEEGGSSRPVASLVVVQAPVGDASAAAVGAELARGIEEGVAAAGEASSSVLLLAALRLPGASVPRERRPGCCAVFRGGDVGAFPEGSSSSASKTLLLPRDARISDGFVAALALALPLSLGPSSRVALAAVDGRRPPAVPLGASASAAAAEAQGDLEALDAASALGEAAAEALGARAGPGGAAPLRFSRARAARLVPSRAALLEAAAASSSAAACARSDAAADVASAPPLPLLQGAEQMYG